ncbi:MAG TPA: DsrE family protein [Methylomirabilota bacterium]|nr:DsrE family protein [Methylomirabilota bacterium]
MSRYLLIESKGPLDGGQHSFELGSQLRDLQHQVTIYLVQDGVFAARKQFEAGQDLLGQARARNLTVLADEVSLRQRGLNRDRLASEVKVSGMDELTDLLMERSDKAIWH